MQTPKNNFVNLAKTIFLFMTGSSPVLEITSEQLIACQNGADYWPETIAENTAASHNELVHVVKMEIGPFQLRPNNPLYPRARLS